MHWIRYVLVLWKWSLHFILSFAAKIILLYLVTESWNINDAIMSLNEHDVLILQCTKKEFWQQHEYSTLTVTITFINDSERFDQPLFLTIIKTILIPSSITFLNFLFKKSKLFVLQLGFLDRRTLFLTLLFTNEQ